jgi:hypothetical protein
MIRLRWIGGSVQFGTLDGKVYYRVWKYFRSEIGGSYPSVIKGPILTELTMELVNRKVGMKNVSEAELKHLFWPKPLPIWFREPTHLDEGEKAVQFGTLGKTVIYRVWTGFYVPMLDLYDKHYEEFQTSNLKVDAIDKTKKYSIPEANRLGVVLP